MRDTAAIRIHSIRSRIRIRSSSTQYGSVSASVPRHDSRQCEYGQKPQPREERGERERAKSGTKSGAEEASHVHVECSKVQTLAARRHNSPYRMLAVLHRRAFCAARHVILRMPAVGPNSPIHPGLRHDVHLRVEGLVVESTSGNHSTAGDNLIPVAKTGGERARADQAYRYFW